MPANKKEDLRKIETDYRTTITILEHLSDAIFILNANGLIEYANKTALDILRKSFSEITGVPFSDILDPEFFKSMPDSTKRDQGLIEKISSGTIQDVEIDLVNREYRTPVVLSFGLVRERGEKIAYVIVSAKDITVKRELERKLSQQQMLAIAKDRYRELGEMAVSMVHELSQPLTTLRLSMELTNKLIDHPEDKSQEVKASFEKMMNLINTMSRSISNVRVFANQTEDDTMKAVSLVRAIEEARELVSYELKNRDISIEIKEQANLSDVLANPLNIQQVFVTLIKSYWEHFERFTPIEMEKEQWKKEIEIHLRNNDQKWIEVTMKDNIDLDAQSFLEPAEKESQSKRATNSMDLHLATVQIIVNSLGGDLRLHPRSNGSLQYTMRIPVDHKEERDELYNLIEMLQD